ncbi:MAG: ABC transporter permease [Clostridiales bacterium]|nr:ABC transporter permease [Clostridiales bacterium]
MFKYDLKKTLSEKVFIFWSMIFPLALMSCFYWAFGGIYDIENSIDTRSVGVIYESDNEFATYFGDVLEQIASEEDAILSVSEVTDKAELYGLLEQSKIDGVYLVKEDSIEVLMNPKYSATDSMILKAFGNFYVREYDMIEDAVTSGNIGAVATILDGMNEDADYMSKEEGIFAQAPNPYLWYFYSTLVMGILFQAMSGIYIVEQLQADLGVRKVAMRTSVSPVPKSRLIVSVYLSRLLVALGISAVTIILMNRLFKVPVGNRLPQLILLVVAANMFAISMGEMFGLFFKGSMSSRSGKGTGVIMASVFLSGEMIATLPGVFERYAPIVNDINPATVLNFALYRLVYYEDLTTFYIEIAKIVLVTVVFLVIATMKLRRQKYASL